MNKQEILKTDIIHVIIKAQNVFSSTHKKQNDTQASWSRLELSFKDQVWERTSKSSEQNKTSE